MTEKRFTHILKFMKRRKSGLMEKVKGLSDQRMSWLGCSMVAL